MFNTKYIEHLKSEIEIKNARIKELERLNIEILDKFLFQQAPTRIVEKRFEHQEKQKKQNKDWQAQDIPQDSYTKALALAEEEMKKKQSINHGEKPKEEVKL